MISTNFKEEQSKITTFCSDDISIPQLNPMRKILSVDKFQNFHESREFFTLLRAHPVPDQINPNIPFLQHLLQNYPQSYA
jgi:hypothetical protein